jgi:glycosyltransferase involved in cell wall biosynthesis
MPHRQSLGGPAACEPPFVEELRRQGVEVEEEIYAYGDKLQATRLDQRVRRVVAAAVRLRRRLAGGRFDLLHMNSSFDARALLRDFVTVSLIGRTQTRIFIKFHGSDADLLRTRNLFLKMFVRTLLERVDGIGVLSSEEKCNFVAAGQDAKKIFVVKNVVERDLAQHSADFNAQTGLAENTPILLFIARFIPAKGLLDVIRAAALLKDRSFNFFLLCIGDGPARSEAEEEVKRLGLNEHVRFPGMIPEHETAKFYVNSTMLVFPTYHYEGFPMSVFYALAAGRPIITTRIRAAADYLREPENCLWVEPRNPAMLAEKITELLTHSQMRLAMGENNRKLAKQFSAAPVAQAYLDIYRDIIASG